MIPTQVFISVCMAFLLSTLLCSDFAVAASSMNFTASAVVLSKNQCRFLSNNVTLDFGDLNPLSGAVANASTTVAFRCQGSAPVASFSISDDDGLHETGPDANRMQHLTDTGAFIPYALSLSPINGTAPKNVAQTLTISGTIAGADYQTAIPGSYADLVVLSILP